MTPYLLSPLCLVLFLHVPIIFSLCILVWIFISLLLIYFTNPNPWSSSVKSIYWVLILVILFFPLESISEILVFSILFTSLSNVLFQYTNYLRFSVYLNPISGSSEFFLMLCFIWFVFDIWSCLLCQSCLLEWKTLIMNSYKDNLKFRWCYNSPPKISFLLAKG